MHTEDDVILAYAKRARYPRLYIFHLFLIYQFHSTSTPRTVNSLMNLYLRIEKNPLWIVLSRDVNAFGETFQQLDVVRGTITQ